MITLDNVNRSETEEWFDDYADQDDDFQIDEYDLTTSLSNFNDTVCESRIIKVKKWHIRASEILLKL